VKVEAHGLVGMGDERSGSFSFSSASIFSVFDLLQFLGVVQTYLEFPSPNKGKGGEVDS